MCLITYQKRAKTAHKDIFCYKLLVESVGGDKFFSISQKFTWVAGVVYTTRLMKYRDANTVLYYDDVVLLKYFPEMHTMLAQDIYFSNWFVTAIVSSGINAIQQGFHAAKSKTRFDDDHDGVIKEMLIPKGSRYFEDDTGLIVANKMMLLL